MGLAKTAFDLGVGVQQYRKGSQLANVTERPWMEIPKEAKQSLAIAKETAAQTKLPGQDLFEQKLDEKFSNYADALSRLSVGSAGDVNNLNLMYGENLDTYRDLDIAGAQYRQQNQQALQRELGNMADWRQKSFMYNFDEPYRIKSATASALKGAGIQNVSTGVKEGEETAADLAKAIFSIYTGMPSMPTGGGSTSKTTATTPSTSYTTPTFYNSPSPLNPNYVEPPPEQPIFQTQSGFDWMKFPGS